MKKSILKLLLFVLAIIVFVATTKFAAYYYMVKNTSFKPFFKHTISDSSCYFIGSSRIRECFDEKLMKQKIAGTTFHNLGINALSMNYGLILANKIISKTNNNIIFIELSRFKPYRSPRCYDIFNYSDISEGLNSYYNSVDKASLKEFKTFLTDIGEFTFNFFSLKEDLSILADPKNGMTTLANSRIEKSFYGDSSDITYLNPLDLALINKYENYNKYCHIKLLNTIVEGENKNIQVVFTLPIAFSDAEEKVELLALYNSIPKKNKSIYSEEFLTKICKMDNLYDKIHFNLNGAAICTNEWAAKIEKLLK